MHAKKETEESSSTTVRVAGGMMVREIRLLCGVLVKFAEDSFKTENVDSDACTHPMEGILCFVQGRKSFWCKRCNVLVMRGHLLNID
jgi:hypothetical protein